MAVVNKPTVIEWLKGTQRGPGLVRIWIYNKFRHVSWIITQGRLWLDQKDNFFSNKRRLKLQGRFVSDNQVHINIVLGSLVMRLLQKLYFSRVTANEARMLISMCSISLKTLSRHAFDFAS